MAKAERTADVALKTLETVVSSAAPGGWQLCSAGLAEAEPGVAEWVLRFGFSDGKGVLRDIAIALGLSPRRRILWLRTEVEGDQGIPLVLETIRFHGLGVRLRPAIKLCHAIQRTLREAAAVVGRRPSIGGDLDGLFAPGSALLQPTPTEALLDALVQAALRHLPASERRKLLNLPRAGGVVLVSAWHPSLAAAAPAALARAVGLPLQGFGNGLFRGEGGPALAHLELRTDAKSFDDQAKPALIHEVLANNNSLVVSGASLGRLPKALRDFPCIELLLPPVDRHVFGQVITRLFSRRIRLRGGVRWLAQVLPVDVERAVSATSVASKAVALVRDMARFRSGEHRSAAGPRLAELAGLGEARRHMLDLTADIRAARRGEIAWHDLARGFLLAGPPGTGKTTLARALAMEVDCPFIVLSLTELQACDHLGQHLRAIRTAFDRARAVTPSVLFIDEADSIGSRGEIRDRHNGYYHSAVVNCFLEEIQGFETRGGVIIIAATNHPERIDPALRRAGRLDRTLWLGLPNIDDLAEIFRYHVGKDGPESLDYAALGRLAAGRTGADVELFVRSARRRARGRGDRLIRAEDLVAEIRGTPDAADIKPLPPEMLRRVAAHEAGHTLVRILTLGAQAVSWVSAVPRGDGELGRVASVTEEREAWTAGRLKAELTALLAGRAAEAELLGEDQLSGGAGMGPTSDLARATQVAALMHTALGLGGTLAWTAAEYSAEALGRRLAGDEGLRHRVEASLAEADRAARHMIRQHRRPLAALVTALEAKGELDGAAAATVIAGAMQRPRRSRRAQTVHFGENLGPEGNSGQACLTAPGACQT